MQSNQNSKVSSDGAVLVVGGAGYIGSHMVLKLLEAGHRVVVLDNLFTGYRDAVHGGELIIGDAGDRQLLSRVFAEHRIDVVMHFASYIQVGESVNRPDLYYQNNVINTINLLDGMHAAGVGAFVFSSSAAVYGTAQYAPMDEGHPLVPDNPYGRTKLMIEQVLADYSRAFELRSVSLRYFNAAGADPQGRVGERHRPETHLIPNLLHAVLTGSDSPVRIFGNDYPTPDGTCVRDYIHVDDLCDAHLRAVDYLRASGKTDVFNLGTAKGSSILEVIEATQRVVGRKVPYTVAPRRPGDSPVLVARSDKARRVLGWKPKYERLDDIIETAWHWHQWHGVG